MTGPVTFERNPAQTLQAMFFNPWADTAVPVTDWMASVLGPNAAISYDGYGTLTIENNGSYMMVRSNQYVYLDSTGFHPIDKDVFELFYKEIPS